ncbi:MAG: pyruvate:ferredoxin (flavodoxin) oxidoreductase, partial [Sulfurimonas sp.]|nr:pyruvate:ferredoxin (flavodoxin) oxidoreductase [Sulfurimonas sp.]
QTDNYAQGYFVYDSKKAGAVTTSHLRFGHDIIHSTYLIEKADFVACHQSVFMEKFDILQHAKKGAVFLLNSPFSKDEIWARMPRKIQEELIEKEIEFYVIDAYKVAKETQMGRKINTIMQTCFFSISGVLPHDEAMREIKESIEKTYGKKGDEIVKMNFNAVDNALSHLYKVQIPKTATSSIELQQHVKGDISKFVADVTAHIIEGKGDELSVSQIPSDGTWPSGTTKYEKRNIAQDIPVWDPAACIQCNKCVEVCPHAVIRSKVVTDFVLESAPNNFKSIKAKGKTFSDDENFSIAVSIEDCTGCSLCVEVCPGKNRTNPDLKAINMTSKAPLLENGIEEWKYFDSLPLYDRAKLNHSQVKESQLLEPLFEFSGACPGCGETPYIKLATQLFGDRMIVANATGCSSIYGGNLPTTPWTKNAQGRGPAWSNSLFEDNAEFGLGFRLTIDKHEVQAKELMKKLAHMLDPELVSSILNADQHEEQEINEQRKRVEKLKERLKNIQSEDASNLLTLGDYLVKKSVWIIGGDGWAYDIGYGGLDHVMASGKNVNILVLDTQVYSNTGGQQSKATPTGAVAKFASGGKAGLPKDLAMMAVAYGNVYVARVAMGASDSQTLKAFVEAEKYDGPSIIIAYSHCISHGYDLKYGMSQQKKAVDCGLWATFRYNPDLEKLGQNPMKLDYKGPKIDVKDYMYNEARFKMVEKVNAAQAQEFLDTASHHAKEIYKRYENLTKIHYESND